MPKTEYWLDANRYFDIMGRTYANLGASYSDIESGLKQLDFLNSQYDLKITDTVKAEILAKVGTATGDLAVQIQAFQQFDALNPATRVTTGVPFVQGSNNGELSITRGINASPAGSVHIIGSADGGVNAGYLDANINPELRGFTTIQKSALATTALADPTCKKCVILARDIENWGNPYSHVLYVSRNRAS